MVKIKITHSDGTEKIIEGKTHEKAEKKARAELDRKIIDSKV